jgi:hypothetical protein
MKPLFRALLCCLFVPAGQAAAVEVFSTFGPGNSFDPFNGVDIDGPSTLFPQGFAEQFMPATGVYLDYVDVAVSSQVGAAELSVQVYSDNGGSPGDLLETVQIPHFSNGSVTATFSGNILLETGSSYWLGLFTTNGSEQVWHDTTAAGPGLQAVSEDEGASWLAFPSDPFPRAAFRIGGTTVTSDVSLIAPGSAWRYSRGLIEPSTGLEWATAAFNDLAWDFDLEGFGYDMDPLTQTGLLSYVGKELTDMRDDGINPNAYTVLYLRRMFDVADPAALTDLVLELDYDDSFIAYINGVEVARSAFGTVGVPEPFDALGVDHESTNGDPLQPLERFVINLIDDFPGLLQAGGNVLAIQGLNVALDDDDFVLSQISLDGSLSAAADAGDFNGDDSVDAADYVVWRKNPGGIYTPADYLIWRANFGQTAGSGAASWNATGASSAVPEPAAGIAQILAVLTLMFVRCAYRRTAMLLGPLLLLVAVPALRAEVIDSYAALEVFLDDQLLMEDFEGISIHGGTSIVAPNPLTSSTAPTWGILPGVVYSSPDELALYGGQLLGDDSNILTARGNALANTLNITFDNPQLAIGFYLVNITGNFDYHETINFLSDAVVLESLSLTLPSASELFMGRRFAAGITAVQVVSDAFALADNVTWGIAVPGVAGDYNADGTVDAADYVVWRKGVGTTYAPNEYDVWRAHYGQTAGSGEAAAGDSPTHHDAAPEPAAVWLAMLGAATAQLWTLRNRRHRRVAK